MHQSLIAKHFVGAAWLLSLAGCSALINVSDKQCNDDMECSSKGFGTMCVDHVCVDPNDKSDGGASSSTCSNDAQCGTGATPYCMNGSCVNEDLADRFVCPADTTPMTSATVHYTVNVLNYITRKPPTNLTVKACKNADVTCASPLGSFDDTTGMGVVDMDLPWGFIGFFQVLTADSVESYSYVTKQLKQDTTDRDIQLLKPSDLTFLSTSAGVDAEASKGIALVEAFDCTGKSQGGVHFEESTNTATPFYIIDGVPNKTATVSKYNVDSDVADGGFVNIRPDFVTFTARWGIDGPAIGSTNVQIRPGTVTYVDMHF